MSWGGWVSELGDLHGGEIFRPTIADIKGVDARQVSECGNEFVWVDRRGEGEGEGLKACR